MAWSFTWDKTNCILVEPKKEIEGIEKALASTDLFEVYKAGVENIKSYHISNYKPFLENIINNA